MVEIEVCLKIWAERELTPAEMHELELWIDNTLNKSAGEAKEELVNSFEVIIPS